MSLLQHQDFAIYRIRSRYLHCVRDGVGDRLIHVNPLTAPGFRNAGWGNPSEIKRQNSPPIGLNTEYFSASARERFAQLHDQDVAETQNPVETGLGAGGFGGIGLGAGLGGLGSALGEKKETTEGAEEEFAPGRVPMTDKIAMPLRPPTREEDLSSDSDSEPEPEEESMHQLKFSKVPIRGRSDSSPIPSVRTGAPGFSGTPKSALEGTRLRAGSHGTFEFARHNAVKQQEARRKVHMRMDSDSEMSEAQRLRISVSSSDIGGLGQGVGFGDDAGDDSDISDTLSSEFTETVDSNPSVMRPGNFLGGPFGGGQSARQGRLLGVPGSPAIGTLHELPPARPISMVQPVSLLTQMLKGDAPDNPLYQYSIHSGQGELKPINLKVYFPVKKDPLTPITIALRREERQAEGGIRETTVVNAIGFCLYTYVEEGLEPKLDKDQYNVNKWIMRMVDDGEPDMDFPPLERNKPINTFVVRDRRGVQRGPSEFAICLADPQQVEENERLTPVPKPPPGGVGAPISLGVQAAMVPPNTAVSEKPALQRPGTADTNTSITMAPPSSAVTTRQGPTRILRIFMNTVDDFAKSAGISVTSDTTFTEALELICRKKHLNKNDFVLKIFGTTTIMTGEMTVDQLGEDQDLELIRRSTRDHGVDGRQDRSESFSSILRQVDSGPAASFASSVGISGFIGEEGVEKEKKKKEKKKGYHGIQVAGGQDLLGSINYQKFTVWRRQPMSFINRHERTLAIDGEYVHIMPSDAKTLFETPKTTSLHISSIIGCKVSRKAPSNFKIAVLKSEPREIKSYDFEAVNAEQAAEIVTALKEKIETYRLDNPGDPSKRR
ncbi:SIN1-domain-containing protein [Ascobolus immersus RN42]|uniref:SIN1-domain-containing protein n=1 Tax=Ascobolus immersus RN42 TaxID=1160509 RepID=A0A3N4HAW3_ASCIM|nr:SIN1-domain-containing protein [Ascobolus immersus RN42]